ncbi:MULTISPECIES: hypothetical protein [unclassified Streptomyces]|uniref:hypothetical protein n=1 Tax=unclassified Streptomyces TaxID=2593676 RepID=UPI003329A2B9
MLLTPTKPASLRWTGGRLMQCKDIPDTAVCDAIRRTPGTGAPAPAPWRMRWDVQAELERTTGPIPERLFLAKMRRLFAKGLVGGCDCGCRGDYHLTEECGHNGSVCGTCP